MHLCLQGVSVLGVTSLNNKCKKIGQCPFSKAYYKSKRKQFFLACYLTKSNKFYNLIEYMTILDISTHYITECNSF